MYEVLISHEAEKYYKKQDRDNKLRLNKCIYNLSQEPLSGSHIKRLHGEFYFLTPKSELSTPNYLPLELATGSRYLCSFAYPYDCGQTSLHQNFLKPFDLLFRGPFKGDSMGLIEGDEVHLGGNAFQYY
jgi:hypothetical protein